MQKKGPLDFSDNPKYPLKRILPKPQGPPSPLPSFPLKCIYGLKFQPGVVGVTSVTAAGLVEAVPK